ncbi:MAG: FliI/YscN family ATPase [Pseudomonadota bacterium]
MKSSELDAFFECAGPQRSGTVISVDGVSATIAGLGGAARLGDCLIIETSKGPSARVSVTQANDDHVGVSAFSTLTGIAPGDRALLDKAGQVARPCEAWIGQVIDPFGYGLGGGTLVQGDKARKIDASPPSANLRKSLGPRLPSGLCAFDTFLPIARGQRLGIFAGPGVGKSTLLNDLAQGIEADIVIVAMIGERSREVGDIIHNKFRPELMKRAIVFVSTADQAPMAKKLGAYLAMTTAEHFRDQNKNVLLVFDSLTRFAEAHREVALSAGEPPTLHGFPPSAFRELARLVERAGPGLSGTGDITALFSVLVEGADIETAPAADTIRGILDGHIVLERKIAERGRFPAVDILRSVSRSLPDSASRSQNELLAEARRVLSLYEDSEIVIRAGLYEKGTDPATDRAIALWPSLDSYLSARSSDGIDDCFDQLRNILQTDEQAVSG